VMLGEGWYAGRVALLQLNVELPGGKVLEIVTDTSWKAAQGPITSDSIYHGESYDATRETAGWDRAGFDDAAWMPAALASPAPTGVLSAQMMPAIRVVGEIIPLKVTSPRAGVYVYDFGQNFSGWLRLRVRGPRGATVRIRHAELLYEDGNLNVENLRTARATDTYTLGGSAGDEIYEPRFTYHGFRYAELSGYPGTPRLDSVVARIVNTDVKAAGGFVASKALLNQVQRLILWGTTSNLHSVPTDCNQRNERMGWMADAHLNAETAMYNFDMAAFFAMWLRNMRDNQAEDGSVPDTVPRAAFARGPADPAWGAAYPIILWYMYQHYGDRRLLEQHFDGIRAWADFLTARSEGGILNFVKFGDWVPVMPTPGNLVSTTYWYWSVDTVARVANLLGRSAEAEKYRAQGEDIKAAFHKRFYNADNRNYGNGSQTANLLPLYLNMVPKDAAGAVRGFLRNDVVYTQNTHLTTGILGTKYLLPYLARTGNPDLAYELAVQTSYPSWGYMIERGATTLWELWQEKTGPSMNSHNHPMFGSVGAYYYSTLAGIENAADSVAYQKLRIAPTIVRDLQWVSGTYDSVRGPVAVDWRHEGDRAVRQPGRRGAAETRHAECSADRRWHARRRREADRK
jgi:alpha-L-rhamnosidase